MAGVELHELSRRFGEVDAVRGLSLEIGAGETFGLLGPNGAGKTTTLSMLSTLLAPSSGDATIFGTSLRRDPREIRRYVGLAPQELSLYPGLTGEENLHFLGSLYAVPGRVLRARSDRLLELVGLTARRRHRVATYSGGMKRRLSLACSLVHGPRLVLLDEPTVGVDPQSRANIFDAVAAIAAEGNTVLYTTHYMEEAERLCDRIAIMDDGRILGVGTLAELLDVVGAGEVIELRGTWSDASVERLRALPDVTRVEVTDWGLCLSVQRTAPALHAVTSVLDAVDGEPEGVEIHRMTLERVFMHLTGRALRD